MTAHALPEVTKAVSEQAGRILHTSSLYLGRAMVELAERIAALPKTAIAATKAAIYKGLRQTLDENLSEMYFAVGWLHHSDDHKEGVRAFVEKRQPQFNRTAQ
jgi:enoyl-CoA hydratase/carnithine racemase